MTKQEEPSVLELAELWARIEQIREEHLRVANLDPATFEGDERKAKKLAKLESEHIAALEALGIADDKLFDPFGDVPRPASAQQALMDTPKGIKPPPDAHPPEQVKPPRKPYRRIGWRQTPAFDYVVEVFARIAPATCKELCAELKKAAATVDTPLGVKHGCFFDRETGKALADKTIENAMPAIRAQAKKLPPNPHFPAKNSRE